jgi:methyl-accepting chemotaxis protein
MESFMQTFYNLKIRTKLIISFLAVLLLMIALGALSLFKISNVNKSTIDIGENWMASIRSISTMNISVAEFRIAETKHILTQTKERRDKYEKDMEMELGSLKKGQAAYEPLISSKQEKELYEKFKKEWADFLIEHSKIIEFSREDKDEEARAILRGESEKHFAALSESLEQLVEINNQGGLDSVRSSKETYASAQVWIIGVLVVAVLLGIVLAMFIAHIIGKPVQALADMAEKLALGDMRIDIKVDRKDEIGTLLQAFDKMVTAMNEVTSVATEIAAGNLTVTVRERSSEDKLMQALSKMVNGLTETVANIQTVANQVMAGSEELSSSAEQLSQGATEQSSSVEEVSASMEQMAANIKQNSENAQQTEKMALKAAEDGKQGGQAVTETVSAMKEIASKISIIEEIARQTNLLALNAAIEAARAGEHGKGFAVVASEVRKLAERSQEAAGEINQLAKTSVNVAEQAGSMLTKIVPDIQKTADLVQEINAASNEQTTGAEQINKAVQQLDSVIQQNASASEEMASTSEELLGQAEQLQNTIAFFRIGGDGVGANRTSASFHGPANGRKTARANMRKPTQLVQARPTQIAARDESRRVKGVDLDLRKGTNGDREDEHFEEY